MTKKWTAENVHASLQEIKIASPCHVSIEKMEDRGNCFHCHECKLNVYHFSSLTNAEIADLLNQNNEKLCVGMFKREDGTVITKDCPLGLADLGFVYRRSGLLKAASFLMFLLLSTSFASVFDPLYLSLMNKINGVQVVVSEDDPNQCLSYNDQFYESCTSITHPKVVEGYLQGRGVSSANFMGKR
ncbi:MAG: hypothetical protein WC635_12090 [Bacteriovorax sp.]|jgi:hypothetical protein